MHSVICTLTGVAFLLAFPAVGWWERRKGRAPRKTADYFGTDARL